MRYSFVFLFNDRFQELLVEFELQYVFPLLFQPPSYISISHKYIEQYLLRLKHRVYRLFSKSILYPSYIILCIYAYCLEVFGKSEPMLIINVVWYTAYKTRWILLIASGCWDEAYITIDGKSIQTSYWQIEAAVIIPHTLLLTVEVVSVSSKLYRIDKLFP